MARRHFPLAAWIGLLLTFAAPLAPARAAPVDKLEAALRRPLDVLAGRSDRFALRLDARVRIDGKEQAASATMTRLDAESVSLVVDHPQFPIAFLRTIDRTVLELPYKHATFVGTGEVRGNDVLAPAGAAARLLSDGTALRGYATLLAGLPPPLATGALTKLAGLKSDDGRVWTSSLAAGATLTLGDDDSLDADWAGGHVRLSWVEAKGADAAKDAPAAAARPGVSGVPAAPDAATESHTINVDRAEFERLFARGLRRTLEVVAPSAALSQPEHVAKQVPHGDLRWVGDQRLVRLWGTPAEIGRAHGLLLAAEARRCADSAMRMVGIADTFRSGLWFPDRMRGIQRRLDKFIPDSQKQEVDALADAAGFPREDARLANVFPELFHCSGFALFGNATADGKLYHGRVLDYMTVIGLQDCAATFVVAPEGKIAFANVGYAGFVGCVSGMNARQVSLGEMGGRGEGLWDGVPMATLMRRALEECDSLDAVKALWTASARTCAYYYVWSDGKIPSAVGVAATPESVQFITPGEGHPLLGEGIPDAVVLSAGDRLKTLRRRVREGYGSFDAPKGMALMSRPVATGSNLHNVLFVPQDMTFYVANADHKSPAAERPYQKYDFGELLRHMPAAAKAAAAR